MHGLRLVLTTVILVLVSLAQAKDVMRYGNIPVLILHGSYNHMGMKYGQALRVPLHTILALLQSYYHQKGLSIARLRTQGNLLYWRFTPSYQHFIQGEAIGANLSLDQAIILNAMETLGEALNHPQPGRCAFVFVPPNMTKTHLALIGRNYDYPPPFDQLAQYLTVTILEPSGAIPTAFIAIAGEIYCPSCINAHGLFMALNNGMPSGGSTVNVHRQSLLITLLTTLQQSATLSAVKKQMQHAAADYSLIINSADAIHAKSFEFSSTLGLKSFDVAPNLPFVSTNFYLDSDWGRAIPIPTDRATSMGITRRNNLLHLINQVSIFDVGAFEDLMNVPLERGGALWRHTIYQLIFDESDQGLYVKIVPISNDWTRIPLGKLFDAN